MRSSAQVTIRIRVPRMRRKLFFFLFFLGLAAGLFFARNTLLHSPSVASAQVSCSNRGAAFVFLIDRSGSMGKGTKLADARDATINFINRLRNYVTNPVSYAGAISISNSPPPDAPSDPLPLTKLEWRLTQFYDNVINAVNKITTAGGATCISCAIKLANEQFSQYSNDGRRRNVIIIISDGGATKSINGFMDQSNASNEALSQAAEAVKLYDATIFTINIDPNASNYEKTFLQKLADSNPNGQGKYFEGDSSSINSALDQIFKVYSSATISGFKYNDANTNRHYDDGEAKLPNWQIELRNFAGTLLKTDTTDDNGNYSFDGLCNGTYTVNEVAQSGWDKEEPIGDKIFVPITDLKDVSGQNFGNAVAKTHSIQGLIYVDTNDNGRLDIPEPLYQQRQKITLTNQSTQIPVSVFPQQGTYTFPDLPSGKYTVEYEQDGFLPDDFSIYPRPPTYLVTVGPGCTYPPSAQNAQCTAEYNIINLNFGLQNSTPWIQDEALDMRFDNGVDDKLPLTPACPGGSNASIVGRGGFPGVIFSGGEPYDFGLGSSSVNDWIAGGSNYPEKFRGSGALQTSYSTLLSTVNKSDTKPQPLPKEWCGGSYQSCTLNNGNNNGPYTVEGDLNLNKVTITGDTKIVLLVRGNVTINNTITTPVGSYFLISASGNITVSSDVGITPSCSTTPLLQGIFVTDYLFTIKGAADCPTTEDLMLTVGGTIVDNALRINTSEQFDNERNLCDDNLKYPSIRMIERSDFALNTPEYISPRAVTWKEVAP